MKFFYLAIFIAALFLLGILMSYWSRRRGETKAWAVWLR